MVTEAEVKEIVRCIKCQRSNWEISHRPKNAMAMVDLGIDFDTVLDEIYVEITWRDYVKGPEDDKHTPTIPGDVWVFGLELEGFECYLKFQIKEGKIIYWISTHPAEHSLQYPFK